MNALRPSPLPDHSSPPAAAGVVLQRVAVAPAAYLAGLIGKNSGDPEWDPQWSNALNHIVAKAEFQPHLSATIDDESEVDILRLLAVLKSLGDLSNDKPNRYRIAVDAVRWDAGIESDSGGSGFGNLELDVLGDAKAQTEIAQTKASALNEPMAIIDNVVSGKVPIAELREEFVRTALVEFMTYLK